MKTEKAIRWAHKCVRKGFDHTKITKDNLFPSFSWRQRTSTEDNPEPPTQQEPLPPRPKKLKPTRNTSEGIDGPEGLSENGCRIK